ncbi:MAG: FMN-binding protein [Candidatus Omnitrophica bacterium]|nr:FMN-binding protein [Candidatus Omnitrophota bacterium]
MARKAILDCVIFAVFVTLAVSLPVFAEKECSRPLSFEDLKKAFPSADQFSYKEEFREGSPPVYKAFYIDKDSGENVLLGYVLETHDWAPDEKGYRGPIKMVVGVDLDGKVVDLAIIEHGEDSPSLHEIEDGWFLKQFIGKRVSDDLEIGKDIEAVSQATITSGAIARTLKETLARLGGPPLAGAKEVKIAAETSDERKEEDHIGKERELDEMLKSKNLSLTPAKYYRQVKEK